MCNSCETYVVDWLEIGSWSCVHNLTPEAAAQGSQSDASLGYSGIALRYMLAFRALLQGKTSSIHWQYSILDRNTLHSYNVYSHRSKSKKCGTTSYSQQQDHSRASRASGFVYASIPTSIGFGSLSQDLIHSLIGLSLVLRANDSCYLLE